MWNFPLEPDESDPDKLFWDFTNMSLSDLGVKDILLTGQTYPGCASTTEERLKESFNVTVLPETFPQFYQRNLTPHECE